MLGLKDFIHLPRLVSLFDEIAVSGPGVVLLAGLEQRPRAGGEVGWQPSGRSAIAGILLRQILAARPSRVVVVAASKDAIRLPPRQRARAEFIDTDSEADLRPLLDRALGRAGGLVVFDRLSDETASLAFHAAARGARVVAQIDSIFRGRDVLEQLVDAGVPGPDLQHLHWVVSVARLPLLCTNCREPETPDLTALDRISVQLPAPSPDARFYKPGQCDECSGSGRRGQVAAFDIYRPSVSTSGPLEGHEALSLEEYVFALAEQGLVPLQDLFRLEARQAQSTFRLLMASEQELARVNAAMNSKLAELEAANRVLQKQTKAAISLEEMSHALITYSQVDGLAAYVCRKASELCGADRGLLYLLRDGGESEIVAVNGWEVGRVERRVKTERLLASLSHSPLAGNGEPLAFFGWPPGVPPRSDDLEGAKLQAGLAVPLTVDDNLVGVLIFHSTLKRAFTTGEIALLGSFADSSAAAIQRARLLSALTNKVDELEAAQGQIAKKERLERELELARQVQQSMLPHIFPFAPGFEFAARYQAARQVGGDLYDVFLLDGNRFGVVIADVSDKGLPAALFMALTRSLILAEARREPSPDTVLQRVHRLLRELAQSEQFVTVFYGVVDMGNKSLRYVRAGHEPALLIHRGESIFLSAKGVVLGMIVLDELPLVAETIHLETGDRLVLFTDGIVDALSAAGQPFGRKQLAGLLTGLQGRSIEESCDAVFAAVNAHQAETEQYDDMTLLAVQVK
ncbi:MAG: SpoIIE family protein phosphatase [Rudaea sp.]